VRFVSSLSIQNFFFCDFKTKSSEPLELVHFDVWGPALISSYNNYRYFVIFIDDYFRTTWLYLMKNKSEIFSHFQTFSNLVETQFNKTKLKLLELITTLNLLIKNFQII
jgi:hypothetical protein